MAWPETFQKRAAPDPRLERPFYPGEKETLCRPPQPQTRVGEALDHLEGKARQLREMLAALDKRLAPVIQPETSENPVNPKDTLPASCRIIDRLAITAAQLDACTEFLSAWDRSLDL